MFGHEISATAFTRSPDLSLQRTRQATERSRLLFRHNLAIWPLLCPPIWITHSFFINFNVIGFGILLLSHDITGWGDDLHAPKFSLLPLQERIAVNFGGDGPKMVDSRRFADIHRVFDLTGWSIRSWSDLLALLASPRQRPTDLDGGSAAFAARCHEKVLFLLCKRSNEEILA